jgi:hypothetical protein
MFYFVCVLRVLYHLLLPILSSFAQDSVQWGSHGLLPIALGSLVSNFELYKEHYLKVTLPWDICCIVWMIISYPLK